MKKSDHTELAVLSRLVVHASQIGLAALTYGQASAAAHLSRGGLQRYFASRETMLTAVLGHACALMHESTFGYARERAATEASAEEVHEMAFSRWLTWISGELALPGGCVLTAALGQFNEDENDLDTRLRREVRQHWQDWLRVLSLHNHAALGQQLASLGLTYFTQVRVLAREEEQSELRAHYRAQAMQAAHALLQAGPSTT
jgi:AcrR family transcriptional regulator